MQLRHDVGIDLRGWPPVLGTMLGHVDSDLWVVAQIEVMGLGLDGGERQSPDESGPAHLGSASAHVCQVRPDRGIHECAGGHEERSTGFIAYEYAEVGQEVGIKTNRQHLARSWVFRVHEMKNPSHEEMMGDMNWLLKVG